MDNLANKIAKKPLDAVEVDHTQLDVYVSDDVTGVVIGRPWVAVVVDVFSRKVLCMYLSFDTPSGDSIRNTIEDSWLPNGTNEASRKDNQLILDSKAEHWGEDALAAIVKDIRDETKSRFTNSTHDKATLERLFGDIERLCAYKVSSVQKWSGNGSDNPSTKEIGLKDLRAYLTTYITEYNSRKNQ